MASLQLLWDFLLLCRSNGLVSFNFPEEEMHRKVEEFWTSSGCYGGQPPTPDSEADKEEEGEEEEGEEEEEEEEEEEVEEEENDEPKVVDEKEPGKEEDKQEEAARVNEYSHVLSPSSPTHTHNSSAHCSTIQRSVLPSLPHTGRHHIVLYDDDHNSSNAVPDISTPDISLTSQPSATSSPQPVEQASLSSSSFPCNSQYNDCLACVMEKGEEGEEVESHCYPSLSPCLERGLSGSPTLVKVRPTQKHQLLPHLDTTSSEEWKIPLVFEESEASEEIHASSHSPPPSSSPPSPPSPSPSASATSAPSTNEAACMLSRDDEEGDEEESESLSVCHYSPPFPYSPPLHPSILAAAPPAPSAKKADVMLDSDSEEEESFTTALCTTLHYCPPTPPPPSTTAAGAALTPFSREPVVYVLSSDDEEEDSKLENLFTNLRIQSAKKAAASQRVVSRKSLSVFIVSDSEDVSEEDEEKENRPPLGGRSVFAESPLMPYWERYSPSVSRASPPTCSTPAYLSTSRSRQKIQSSVTTPSANKSVRYYHHQMARELYQLFNSTVFDNKLPQDLDVQWNKRLRTTAGFCSYKGSLGKREVCIELSTKICDTYDRIRDTLIHEMCHAANWLIDGTRKAGHGRQWKAWAQKATAAHPDLTTITRCHSYEIAYKYTYHCTVCDFRIGRHSKSVNLETARCPYCTNCLELQS